jgi:hypothetical protein
MTEGEGNGSAQDWDAYPPGAYAPPAGYGPPSSHGGPAYGRPAHVPPAAYGSPAYGPFPGYGAPPAYGPPPGYGPLYGAVPPAGWAGAPQAWPYGPRRPGVATAAAVLGFVTGGLTALVSLIILLSVTRGDGDPSIVLMLLGLPCAIAVIAGAAALMSRGSPGLLFGAAVASVGVLFLVAVVGMATLDVDDMLGRLVLVVLALPLPILTAVFARQPRVRGWAAAG